ncbi:hypothetical protein HKK55_06675 [Pseudomonas sp. ADAK18]|uniref:hypothetical protein n=1 Tax=Pseudomonas sp. ADAK18 TaxID=2730848 RepID=UPI0014644423|nr:hypothetical protein [Pseudomonas sp. ADAK18]QJI28409.1 hypothetical protein HKK55_06675 [Pseudomonas sp. ADAK18]
MTDSLDCYYWLNGQAIEGVKRLNMVRSETWEVCYDQPNGNDPMVRPLIQFLARDFPVNKRLFCGMIGFSWLCMSRAEPRCHFK